MFAFGKNWKSYLNVLNDERIAQAEESLKSMLKVEIKDLAVLDIGCGSGLFSLSTRRLGAKVTSFDFDKDSVEAALYLKKQYFPGDVNWKIIHGSVLDNSFLSKLDKYDIVYSWGVLHHTGDMWKAFDNLHQLLKSKGILFISIYNNQGLKSKYWFIIKKCYNNSRFMAFLIKCLFIPYFFSKSVLMSILNYGSPFKVFIDYKLNRGMSIYHDWIDWLGGYPFQVATPEEIFDYFYSKGYTLIKLKTTNSIGCNEFVFRNNDNGICAE